ncbi:1-phosphatidylinositol 4,5-bisphosphate phosphodiesterase eta-1 isoform X3 [Denticeps clupeoides]|uniref:1-phosphatidylinositol 4,5-bisphosphate phosphodiesterase eta-1 isoform X3 n=1 Tax=Denticeps clupeoides TaxID=299321 RepID=UPI0010A4F4E6|nr:1-phosphatidylinositol 4,5-bisphosphate phosphodiesterase eta-1 isoform X3 [Denticeps clupeoides]
MELCGAAERSSVASAASQLARRIYHVGGCVAVPHKCRLALLVERCMSVMQSGTQMIKLKNGSKGLVRLFYLDEHRSCIRWRPSRKSEKAKITIDSLYKVTEGRQSDIFHRHAEGSFDPACCFTIYHGNHMESLDLVTSNAEEARTWVTGLRYLMAGISDEDSLAKRQRTHDQWMKQTFEEADKNGDGLLNIDEIYQLLHKLNVNLPRRKVKQMFQEADTDDRQGTLTFEEFSVFYKMMSLRRDLFLLLMCYSEKKDHVTAEELGNFLRAEQKMTNVTVECCLDIIDKFEVSEENKQQGILGIEGFTNFMRSPTCDIFNPSHHEVNQDMDQSLSNYFIASSHNTYLTGDQLLSHSKTDMYAWVLQAGCRCVEVDCWDGPDGEPMVQHGYTLTSKITFKSVVETINKYAFINNEFPVILSIENHCSIQQQKKIAQHLKEIFGDKLDVCEALHKDPKQLPSPNSLKGKILIKGKRLPPYISADAEEGEVSDDDSADEIEDDFKLQNTTSNGSSQNHVESHIRKKLDSLLKESQIGDKEDTDSFSIRALLRATHEGLQKNLRKNSREVLKKSQSRSFISNLKHKRHSKSKLKCQSTDEDDGHQEASGKETCGQFNRGVRRRKTIKLSRDLSDLVVLTNSQASQEGLDEGSALNVLSFSETRAQQLVHHRVERFLSFNQRQLSRIYPSAYRIDSSNFNPQVYWNAGCQLVALNYQTEGRMMQLNRAKFMVNGGSGYVLKPPPMCKGSFNPYSDDPLPAYPKKQLLLKIISGQQLPKPPDSMLGDRGEIIDPFVEVEIIGIPVDCCKEQTRVVDDNGFNPVWEETLTFTVHMPEVALVRFLVWDHDPIGRDFVGQRTVAFSSLMPGYRHVYLEGMTEASIFVHVTVHDIYGKGRQLRGIRGLFNRSSKSSVDAHTGLPLRKRSLSDHILRRTASAPAKGRKKIKMPVSESVSDWKSSAGDTQAEPEVVVEHHTSPRAPLQHRPASMPVEKLLQDQLTLTSPVQEHLEPGADTLIGLVTSECPRSVSVDLLIETSASNETDGRVLPVALRNSEPNEMDESSYLVIGGGENTGNPLTVSEKNRIKERGSLDTAGNSLTLQSEILPGDLQNTGSDLNSQKGTPKACFSPSSSLQIPLHDSALSRLIDAVSLDNEHDSCGSISALIGQLELTVDQSTPTKASEFSISNNSAFNRAPSLHSHKHNSSSPLKRTLEAHSPYRVTQVSHVSLRDSFTPHRRIMNTSVPCRASYSPVFSEPLLASPETTEPDVYTILDEEVLSPGSPLSACNYADNVHMDSLGSSPIKQKTNLVTHPWHPCMEGNHEDHDFSNRSLQPLQQGYGCTSMNSEASDDFLLCQNSVGSSLMEVEINVDGDPLETTTILTNHAYSHDNPSSFSQPSPTGFQPPLACGPFHRPKQLPSHTHKTIYNPFPLKRPQHHDSHNTMTLLGDPQQTKDLQYISDRTRCFHNGHTTSNHLSGHKRIRSPLGREISSPVAGCGNVYSSMTYDCFSSKSSYPHLHPSPKSPPALSQGLSQPQQNANPCKSKSLGDLTSDDISCNFQSKYKVLSRSFINPSLRDKRKGGGMTQWQQSSDPLTEQLRKLVSLELEEQQEPIRPSQPSQHPCAFNSAGITDDQEDPPPFLTRRLSSRSQSRVRHIASRARERQEALKTRPMACSTGVVLRNKSASTQNPPINRHSTGSYIAGYLDQLGLEGRGLPEGSCAMLRYGYAENFYTDDSVMPTVSCPPSEPEVYFLLRL